MMLDPDDSELEVQEALTPKTLVVAVIIAAITVGVLGIVMLTGCDGDSDVRVVTVDCPPGHSEDGKPVKCRAQMEDGTVCDVPEWVKVGDRYDCGD